jgi:hypothetical protein
MTGGSGEEEGPERTPAAPKRHAALRAGNKTGPLFPTSASPCVHLNENAPPTLTPAV